MMNVVNPDAVTTSDILATILLEAIHRERAYLFKTRQEARLREWDKFIDRIAEEFGLPLPDSIMWWDESVMQMARDGFALNFDSRAKVLADIVRACRKNLKAEAQGDSHEAH
jgi:hypothetical protein